MLSWEYPPYIVGGLARHVEELSEALVKKGLEVHVITTGTLDTPQREKRNGVVVHRVEPFDVQAPNFLSWVQQLNFRMVEEGIKLFRQEKNFDLIHAHDWLVAFTARVLKHAYRKPLAVTIHATEAGRHQGIHTEEQRYINSIEWWLTFEGWKVIVCSNYMGQEVQNLFNLPQDKVKVIPNGVDLNKFHFLEKPNISYGPGKIIFFMGRLVREKGVQVLLEAAPLILAADPDVRFLIAGTGPMEHQLKQQAYALGLGDRVQFLGHVNDKQRNEILQQTTLAVFPSLYEPFGIVVLEAMAAGVPVVVSDVGGMGEIVDHGVSGLKVYPGDVNSLAFNIIRGLQNDMLRQELKKQGKRLVQEVYCWDKIAAETQKVYKTILDEYTQSAWAQAPLEDWHKEQAKEERPSPFSFMAQRANFFARLKGGNW